MHPEPRSGAVYDVRLLRSCSRALMSTTTAPSVATSGWSFTASPLGFLLFEFAMLLLFVGSGVVLRIRRATLQAHQQGRYQRMSQLASSSAARVTTATPPPA